VNKQWLARKTQNNKMRDEARDKEKTQGGKYGREPHYAFTGTQVAEISHHFSTSSGAPALKLKS
jgi:hypothetical protein